jgi:hypothetical protein
MIVTFERVLWFGPEEMATVYSEQRIKETGAGWQVASSQIILE